MASRTLAEVTPGVLLWARETLGLSIDAAARSIGVKPTTLQAWESGDSQPSIPQLRKLATTYKRPIAIFFLPTPPEDKRPPRDFRRLPEGPSATLSPNLRLEIRKAELRQSAAIDLVSEDSPISRLLGSATLSADADELAGQMRRELGISLKSQIAWREPYVALRQWTDAIESSGCLVFQASKVEVSEMRGISLYDARVPAILLNAADSPRGRIFSLGHELGHLLLGAVGLCDLDEFELRNSEAARIEVFCNRFSAALLVPKSAILVHPIVAFHTEPDEWSDEDLLTLARFFSVSTEVIARRLVTLDQASQSFYVARRDGFLKDAAAYREGLRKSKGGPPLARRVLASSGHRFTRIVISAYHDEAITGSDVAEYLGIKLDYLPRIEKVLEGAPTRRLGRP
ncbi:MAG: ImmA/IrrE family metallo-endopeptidase [Planctomycetes bacterium]|nr:ImmA/IrrE family metallo-endopeptidase [Planctomycetota bacterium]